MLHWIANVFGSGWPGFERAGASTLDVLIVAFLIYQVMMLAKGTRAWQIILGLIVFVLILFISAALQLTALNWLLSQMFLLGPVAIVILFYPELRHALEEVGRLGFWGKRFSGLNKDDLNEMISEIVDAADSFSNKHVGALIVLERETGLSEYAENGTAINSTVSSELLGTIFYPGTPLHDGAVIIRRDRIIAAGCTLPLSESRDIGSTVHTRHKAALGITEQSDAVAVVVSEETGIISLAFSGRWVRGLRGDDLRDGLAQEYLGRDRTTLRRRRGSKSETALPPASVSAERQSVSLSTLFPTLVPYTSGRSKATKLEPRIAEPTTASEAGSQDS